MSRTEEVYELRLGEDIEALGLGITKMCITFPEGELSFHNGGSEPIQCQHIKDMKKTLDNVRQAFIGSHKFDDKITQLTEFIRLLTHRIIETKSIWRQETQQAKRNSKGKNGQESKPQEPSQYEKEVAARIAKCKAAVKRMKSLNPGISSELWRDGLIERHNILQKTVQENIPGVWPGLEFVLSSNRILNIHGCTLPLIGVMLARPGVYKTVDLSLFKPWPNTYYTDEFSPKAWITHTTAIDSEEDLKKIDMLPKVKNKHFLTPELAPIFTTDEKDLGKILGTITRIADGHGLASDTGAHGHREYGDTMFVWTGAAVDVPNKVYKLLGNLGAKIYFYRLPYEEKTEDQLLENMGTAFDSKKLNIQSALYDYLAWFEIGPDLIHDESGLSKMQWNGEMDVGEAKLWIVRLGVLLSHLRCVAWAYDIDDGDQGSNYGYTHTQPESPERAIEILRNVARGHALSLSRNYIDVTDIPIVVKTVLSTAIIRNHLLEQSPCFPIINVKPVGRFAMYYCEICRPKHANDSAVANIHLSSVEHHCRYRDPEKHLAEVLARVAKISKLEGPPTLKR